MIDQSKKQPDNRIHLFDPVGLINSSYQSPARHVTRSHDAFTGGASPLIFTVETESADGCGDSDASSPPLWKSPPATSPAPDSRTQAIARGRREMMEMIKDMPESTYELSLRDIVDQKSPSPPPPPPQQPDDKSNSKLKSEQRKAAISRSGSKKKVVARSRSIDNGGFLLKTSVFPISFWLKKKSKKNLGSTSSKRKSGVSSESEIGEISRRNGSSSSSSSSSSTISRHGQSNRFLPDCFSFKAKK